MIYRENKPHSMIKQLDEIIHLLENIHGTKCDVEFDLDGSLIIKITKSKINEVRTPEEALFHGNVKLRAMDELHEFLQDKAGRV
jgi:hypothetical protein